MLGGLQIMWVTRNGIHYVLVSNRALPTRGGCGRRGKKKQSPYGNNQIAATSKQWAYSWVSHKYLESTLWPEKKKKESTFLAPGVTCAFSTNIFSYILRNKKQFWNMFVLCKLDLYMSLHSWEVKLLLQLKHRWKLGDLSLSPASSLNCCMSLTKSLNFSEFPFPQWGKLALGSFQQ